MKLLHILFFVSLFFSCSKPNRSWDEDEAFLSKASGLDSLVAGQWTFIGDKTDHSPFFLPASKDNYGYIIFNSVSGYIETRNGRIVDSGRYRVLDSTYIISHQRRLLELKSKMRTTYPYPRFWYLFISNDTLSLSHGLGGPSYKRSSKK